MIAKTLEKKERFVACPQCGDNESHRITGIKPEDSFGPAYCKSCGVGIAGYVRPDGEVVIAVVPERRRPAYVLLRLVPQQRPVYLIVRDVERAQTAEGETEDKEAFFSSLEFMYDHQLCPRVYIGKSVTLLREGDEESYGLFEYVASRPWQGSANEDEDEEDVVLRMFGQHLGLTGQSDVDPGLGSNEPHEVDAPEVGGDYLN